MTPDQVLEYIRANTELEPRPYQSRIVSSVYESFLVEKRSSVLIESPTGSGKTPMMLLCCRLLQEKFGWKIVWIAHRKRLLEQAANENKRINANIEFVSAFSSETPKADLLVVDESQHDAAATFASMHATTGAKFSLGGTATPFRTDRIKLSFEKVIHDCNIRSLIEDNYLCKFNHYSLPAFTPKAVAERFLSDPEHWGKSLFYFQEKDLCLEFQALVEKKMRCEVVFGDTPLSRQEEIHDDFENGKLQALTNVYMLTEGYDMPSLKTVWVRDSGKLCTLQMAGRVLRKDPLNADKIAQVVQSCSARRWPFTRVAKPLAEYVLAAEDMSWRTLAPNQRVAEAVVASRTLLTKPVKLPDFIVNKTKKKMIFGDNEPRRRVSGERTRRRQNLAPATVSPAPVQ